MFQWYKLSLQVSLFFLLTESRLVLTSPNNNEELSSSENEIFSHISSVVKISKKGNIAEHSDIYAQFPYNKVQTTHDTLETNAIDDLAEDDNLKIKHAYEFDKYLAEEQFKLLEASLKKVQKGVNKDRKRKIRKITRLSSTFGSPFEGCSKDPYPASESRTINKYEVNLDAHPEDRWREVVRQNRVQIKKLIDYFEDVLGPKVMSGMDIITSWLYHTLPKEYYQELSGIALETGISVGRVTLYNVFYEFFSLCTSIVLEGNDGNMYHGRNLDFGAFMGWNAQNHSWYMTDILRPLTIKIDFMKNDKLLYSAVSYAGYTGVLTGVKKNAFSLSINERFVKDGGYVGLAEWIMGLRDASWLGLLTRQVMESATTYYSAQLLLAEQPLVAPVYFILAGNTSHQGCIITRGRRDVDLWNLGSKHKQQKSSWYLLETNFDHWEETPFYDRRRQYAVQCMEEIGRQKPLETLYKVLSTKPVLNKETTLTAVMDVKQGLLQVWERYCPDPCWPF